MTPSTHDAAFATPDADALLRGPAAEVFKSDGRSKVWRVNTPAGSFVVKRFEHARPRQVLARLLGIHPAQRERRANTRLRRLGVPVAPIVAHGVERGRSWLATPYLGVSFYNRAGAGEHTTSARRRHAAARALGELTGALLRAGYTNRDHKASNVVVDDGGRLWLIDCGAVRPIRRGGEAAMALHMLAQLERNLGEAVTYHRGNDPRVRITRTDRLRCVRALTQACPGLDANQTTRATQTPNGTRKAAR